MQDIVEISRLVLEWKIFKLVNVFSLFRNDLSLEKGGALNLNTMISAKFGFNSPSESGEEDFLNSSMHFRCSEIISL